jgi:hypothetical protein
MKNNNFVDNFNTMYPSGAWMITNDKFVLPTYCQYCSIYGYSFGESTAVIDGKKYFFENGQYFGLSVLNSAYIETLSKIFIICRLGYITPNVAGWVEKKGRLTYIDGCSDTILVYPARLGDPSLNLLHFPVGIEQTFHSHPSIRLGCVIDGHGFSEIGDIGKEEITDLNYGDMFSLNQQERHRFKTTKNYMSVIAFHPDGDWGPTDHNHIMINRTYIKK